MKLQGITPAKIFSIERTTTTRVTTAPLPLADVDYAHAEKEGLDFVVEGQATRLDLDKLAAFSIVWVEDTDFGNFHANIQLQISTDVADAGLYLQGLRDFHVDLAVRANSFSPTGFNPMGFA